MANELKKPIEATNKTIGNGFKDLNRTVSRTASVNAADQLSDDEVEELRALIADEAGAESRIRERSADEAAMGMYLHLSDCGFIHCMQISGGEIICTGIDPKASWAVERHDKRAEAERRRLEEEERRRREDRRWQVKSIFLGFGLGFVSAVIAPLAGSAIKALTASLGWPIP